VIPFLRVFRTVSASRHSAALGTLTVVCATLNHTSTQHTAMSATRTTLVPNLVTCEDLGVRAATRNLLASPYKGMPTTKTDDAADPASLLALLPHTHPPQVTTQRRGIWRLSLVLLFIRHVHHRLGQLLDVLLNLSQLRLVHLLPFDLTNCVKARQRKA